MKECPKCENELDLLYDEIYECKNCNFMIRKDVYNSQYKSQKTPWHIAVSRNNDLWYKDNIEEYPTIIAREYSILYNFIVKGNLYGAFLKLKDLFEILIKLPVLISMNYIFVKNKKFEKDYELLRLMLEKSLSLGDWRECANKIYNYKMYDDENINSILKDIKKIYFNEKIDIVKWRNDSLGHGALKYENDYTFQKEIVDRLKAISNHFRKCDINYKSIIINFISNKETILLKGTKINMNFLDEGQLFFKSTSKLQKLYPFISIYNKEVYFFDSYIDRKNKVSILNYVNGHKKELVKEDMSNIYHRIYSQSILMSTKVELVNKLLEKEAEENLLLECEKTFNSIQGIVEYTDTKYIEEWLKLRLENEDNGIFLLQMQRGMGKTTFIKALEDNRFKWSELSNSIVRVFYADNIFRVDEKLFNDNLSDLLRTDIEGKIIVKDTMLKGILDTIDNQRERFLKIISYYRDVYATHYNKEKIILVIDAVDELVQSNIESIFNILPNNDNMPSKIYILLTSRTNEEIHYGLLENIKGLSIKDENKLVVYKTSDDNLRVLKEHIEEKFDIKNDELIQNIIKKSDYRFLYLSIIKTLYDYDYNIFNTLNEKHIIVQLLEQIKLTYGEKYFEGIKKVLFIITLGNEPLTIKEIANIYGEKQNYYDLLIYIYEIRTMLNVDRSYRGNLIYISNAELKDFIVNEYKQELEEMLKHWIDKVINIIGEEEIKYDDGESYLISNLFLLRDSILNLDYNRLLNIDNIINLQRYVIMLESYKFEKYISNRYYNINHQILDMQNFLLGTENDLKSKVVNIFVARTLSKLADSLFEDVEIDYNSAVNKYELAINKRFEFLSELGITFEMVIQEEYKKEEFTEFQIRVIAEIAEDYINICRAYYRFGIQDKAEKYCLYGIKLYKNHLNLNENHNKLDFSGALLEIARVYEKNEKYDKSIEEGQKAKQLLLELIEDNCNKKYVESLLARVNECLGTTFLRKGDWERAIKLYHEAIDIMDEESKISLVGLRFYGVLNDKIGKIYLKQKQMKKALKYFEREVEMYGKLDSKGIMYQKLQYIQAYKSIGAVKLDIGLYEEAISAFKLSMGELNKGILAAEEGAELSFNLKFEIFLGLADCLFLSKNYKNSIEYYKLWINLILDNESSISAEDMKLTLERLNQCYEKTGDFLESTRKYKHIKRINKIIKKGNKSVSKDELIYVLYGHKKINNNQLDKDIIIDAEVNNTKFYSLDLKQYKIKKCIKNIEPLNCRYSKTKKVFTVAYDSAVCVNCDMNGCPQKNAHTILKISLKKIKIISNIE